MAALILLIGQIYLGLGAVTAAAFLLWGIDRVDPNARGAFVFRPMLIPGILLIWPLVLLRWHRLERTAHDEQDRHRPPLRLQSAAALLLALLIPVVVFGALVIRQDGPIEREPELLEPPS